MLKRYFFLVFIFQITTQLFATNVTYRHVNKVSGLSSNWVRCIYKDQHGYMWFGTDNALNRYDGISIKTFNFGHKSINDIVKKSDTEFWVATDIGVYYYNIITEKFTLLNTVQRIPIFSIVQENPQVVWFASNSGYYKYNSVKNTTVLYKIPTVFDTYQANYINIVFVDSKNNMWFGTKGGLFHYNRTTKAYTQFSTENSNLSNNEVYAIAEDNTKRLWVGTLQGGLDLIVNTHQIHTKTEVIHVFDGTVMDICIDSKKNLWIATGDGLGKFSLLDYLNNKTPNIYFYKNNPVTLNSISENTIYSIYEDNQNDIWIGTLGSGVDLLSFRGKQFNVLKNEATRILTNNLINVIYEDSLYRWIGTEIGLNRYDKKTKTYKQYFFNKNDSKSLSSNSIFEIKKMADGNLWIGTWAGGINIYNYKTDNFTHIRANKGGNSLNNDNVFVLQEDKHANIWIGTNGGGLNKYNTKTKTFTHYVGNPKNPHSLETNFVQDILLTHDSKIYITASYSLEEYDESIDGFRHYPIPDLLVPTLKDNNLICLFEDSKHTIWVGTHNGLFRFNRKTKMFFKEYQSKFEFDNQIHAIEEDAQGNLWLNTSNGIVKYQNAIHKPKNKKFLHFTVFDGIASNNGKRRSTFFNRYTNTMFFGSSEGYTYFTPDSIKLDVHTPVVNIRSIQILKEIEDGIKEYSPLQINFNSTNTIELEYMYSDFIIDFAVRDFVNPYNHNYKYILEGYDSKWIYTSKNNQARYTNIPPGTYTFKVLASNYDGVWSTTPKTIEITIHPPWWGTMHFKVFVVFCIIGLFLLFIKIRDSRLKKRQSILEQTIDERTSDLKKANEILEANQSEIIAQKNQISEHTNNLEKIVVARTIELEKALEKAKESDTLKTSFLHNISHEIRTPLNAIMGFSDLLPEYIDDKEQIAYFSGIITQKSNDLLRIIEDIINVSLIDSNQLLLKKEVVSVTQLIEQVRQNFIAYRKTIKKEHIALEIAEYQIEPAVKYITDSGKLKQILNNLISNALKFTDQGTITFGIKSIDDKNITFFVRDTGMGIPADKFDYVFERFGQVEVKTSRLYGGTGLGLSIVKGIIKKMGGDIWLESEIEKGSTFYFSIPKVVEEIASSNITETSANISKLIETDTIIKILLVDDDPFNLVYLESILTLQNIELISVETGAKAIDIALNTDIDIVFMDIRLPDISGLEAAKQILEKKSDIKIIAQTAFAAVNDKEKALEVGCVDFVSKPYSKSDILQLVVRYTK